MVPGKDHAAAFATNEALRQGVASFGDAIQALKGGQRVARAGWNGRGMWLALTPGSVVPATAASRSGALLAYVEAEAVERVSILPHIDMRAADGSLVIGWLASQTDMLADDWMVVPASDERRVPRRTGADKHP